MRSRSTLVLASIVATWLAAPSTHAQTVPAGGPTVTLSGQPFPTRVLPNHTNIGIGPRPQNLTPLGISYDDCIADQTLDFNVIVSGFTGGANLQVWATQSGDCTQDADRGVGGVPKCWIVSTGITGLVSQSPKGQDFLVRVQDLVGWQNNPPASASYQALGSSACTAQPSFTAVPLTIYFLPLAGTTLASGAAPLKYSITTDLVGPPAPIGVTIADGDTLFVANWMQNADSDTLGYDVFIDPVPGQAADASTTAAPAASMRVCNPAPTAVPSAPAPSVTPEAGAQDAAMASDASMDATANSDAMVDASAMGMGPGDAMASTDATVSADAAADASVCHYVNVGGATPGTSSGGACNDSNLAGGIVQDAGTTITPVTPVAIDDSGLAATTDASVSTATGGGGVSTVNSRFLIGATGVAGLTVTGESTGTYTITGLTNGTTYNVAVSAVDAYGNIGPPSIEACDFPAPVNDFWKLYRAGGGQAGGGFCAVEHVGAPIGSAVAFAGLGALGLAFMRRRRR